MNRILSCKFCDNPSGSDVQDALCSNCRLKGDLVGEVVWNHVYDEVLDAIPGERVTFMLAGLEAKYLEGIARKRLASIKWRSILLKLHPDAATGLGVDRHLQSDKSAIHWRHSAAADVIVFAPSADEPENIGAGLRPLTRIDEDTIVRRTDDWVKVLGEEQRPREYLFRVLKGLRESQVYKDLESWINFVLAIKEQGYALPVYLRVQKAAPALKIPVDGFEKLPSFQLLGRLQETKDFQRAFEHARDKISGYASLLKPNQEPVDIESVRSNMDRLRNNTIGLLPEEAESAVERLLEDDPNLEDGQWRQSQIDFCERVSWESVGKHIFSSSRKTGYGQLGERTREFIEGNYRDEVTPEELVLLDSLPVSRPSHPKREELEFFDKWRDRLALASRATLFKHWHKRLYSKGILGHDLLTVFERGFEALLVEASDSVAGMTDPCVLVRAAQHNKALFWEDLDRRVQALFQFEYRILRNQFGKSVKWDIDACLKSRAANASSVAYRRRVELEMYLIEASEFECRTLDGRAPRDAPRIVAVWQPGLKPKLKSISLAFPEDMHDLAEASKSESAGVFRWQAISPLPEAVESSLVRFTLGETNTFSDVFGSQDGRTFGRAVHPNENISQTLRKKLIELQEMGDITAGGAERIRRAVDRFDDCFRRALREIYDDPGRGFSGSLVDEQAQAFGQLCRDCRTEATSRRAGKELWPLAANIGIVPSDGSATLAVVAAWHPFRLAERKAKIRSLARFVESVLKQASDRDADISIAFEQRNKQLGRWVFPEVAVVDGELLISIESEGGYSLLVPARNAASSKEALEVIAKTAAENFNGAIGDYLDTHPHERANLSTAIYNLESLTLPRELSILMAKRIREDNSMRCDLVISHQDRDRLQAIYQEQNLLLESENISDTAKSFLSRLRVDVRPTASATEVSDDDVRSLDLILLLDVISKGAQPKWIQEDEGAQPIAESFDPEGAARPRLRLTDLNPVCTEIYLTLPTPPRPVADFQDLLYVQCEEVNIANGSRSALIRRADFDDPKAGELIRRAHRLASWVVTFDLIPSRQLLEHCDVQIVREKSQPGDDRRMLVSSDSSELLTSSFRSELQKLKGIDQDSVKQLAKAVWRDVVRISGQRILSAARHMNSTQEMIGLSVMRAHLTGMISASLGRDVDPIWISLDDYRTWFTSGTGRIADAIGVVADSNGGTCRLLLAIGEAKYVSTASRVAECNDARKQIEDTVEHIKSVLVDNRDPISRVAWCRRLAELLSHQGKLTAHLRDAKRRGDLLERLHTGDIDFEICGEAVVCLHDEHGRSLKQEGDSSKAYLGSAELPSSLVSRYISALVDPSTMPAVEYRKIDWHVGEGNAPITDPIELPPDLPPNGNGKVDPNGIEGPKFIPKPLLTVLEEIAKDDKGSIDDEKSRQWAEEICTRTQRALSNYGMEARFADQKYRLTHNGVLLAFKGHDTLTVDKVERRRGELLTTHGISVVDVRPGIGTVYLFIEREQRAKVSLATTWLNASWPDTSPGEWTSFILGAREDKDGLLYLNLGGKFSGLEEHGPHTLIAGQTGSGKGVLAQGLLLQLIAFNDPAKVKLVLVDPKMGVDYGWIKGAPQLKGDIISDIEAAQNAFEAMVEEMDRRYRLLAKRQKPNIDEYNKSLDGDECLPRIFLVHDELGSWMAQEKKYKDVVLSAVANLGMKARAAGIHLVLITQRADAEAVPSRLRDNMGNKLCLRVQNSTSSRMVLGCGGGEKLLGRGHLAVDLANESTPPGQDYFVLQVPFAETEQIEKLAKAAIDHWNDIRR
ncbi:MAG: FtsK/SpoIIIE domain-containing protein [Rhodobacteraceae bacterium]|nr:FtsK/SpoIIIE domain-containing protein [Paracoccaceae bacterium]